MPKKRNTLADEGDRQLTDAVRESARQIWQAGLGAFAKAQQEGEQAFSQLVRDGSDMQQRTRALTDALAREQAGEVRRTVTGLADARGGAGGTWDKLEQVFEERVARALDALGVPTAAEVAALRADVAQLGEQLRETRAKLAAVQGKAGQEQGQGQGQGPATAPAPVKRAAGAAKKATVAAKKAR